MRMFQTPSRIRRASGALLLLAALGIAGCSSTAGVDALDLGTSNETTSSVARPSAPVAAGEAVAPAPRRKVARLSDGPTPPAPVTDVADASDTVATIAAFEAEAPAPQAIALITPPRPTKRPGAMSERAARDEMVRHYGFRDAKPINFGKAASPRRLAVHGVDVSRWQGDIDWVKLRNQGANFAYIKATDGGDHLDPMFRKNWRGAAEAGLRHGAYHFFYWCRPASQQADWFIRNVPKVPGALPPVIDVEWNHLSNCKKRPSRATVLEKMQVFMDRLEAHYGQRPVIYTAPDFYRDNLRGAFQDYPFWLRAVAQHPSKVYPGRKWLFWQYSGSGLSHGVSGRIDLNVFHGDENAWRAWLGGTQMVSAE